MPQKPFFLNPNRRPKFYPRVLNPENVDSYKNLPPGPLDSQASDHEFMPRSYFEDQSSPNVAADVQTLNQEVLPTFLFASDRAAYYQNEYYKFQWILLFSSLISAIIGALTISAGNQSEPKIGPFTGPQYLGIISVLLGATISLTTGRDRRNNALGRWYLWRRVAEELRKDYFLYLAHVAPYHEANALTVLREKVLTSKQNAEQAEEDANTSTPAGMNPATANATQETAPTDAVKWPHTDEELNNLIDFYGAKRLDAQYAYYASRINEYRGNSEWVFEVSLYLAVGTSIVAFLNTLLGITPVFSICVTLLPVLAAYVVSIERIYGWDRQRNLYFSAKQRLERHQIELKNRKSDPAQKPWEVLRSIVRGVETTLNDEITQWGSQVDQSNRPPMGSQEIIQGELDKLNLSTDEKKKVFDIINNT